jgi:hypothetical protein
MNKKLTLAGEARRGETSKSLSPLRNRSPSSIEGMAGRSDVLSLLSSPSTLAPASGGDDVASKQASKQSKQAINARTKARPSNVTRLARERRCFPLLPCRWICVLHRLHKYGARISRGTRSVCKAFATLRGPVCRQFLCPC